MRYENNDTLRDFLDRGAAGDYREHLRHPSFEIDDAAFAAVLEAVREQHPHLQEEEVQARAVFRLLTCGAAPPVAVALPSRWYRLHTWIQAQAPRAWRWLKIAWAVALLVLAATTVLLLSALTAQSAPPPEPEPDPEPINVVPRTEAVRALLLHPPSLYPQFAGGAVTARMQFLNASNAFVNVSPSNRLPVTCDNCAGGGGGGGTSSSFGAAFPATGTATGFIDAGGNMAGANLDAGGRLITTGAGGTFPVTGTFWQATQPVSGTFWQATQPVSAASLPLPTGAATLAEQQTQTTALQIIDNLPLAQGSTTSGQTGPLVQGAVTTGAPTYTTGQTNPLSLTTAGAVRTDSSDVTQPVSGTVTANAGTNLNTSALSLEATQADVRTALQIIDDWDETDRAKVNPIVGQAGVQGGAGAATATTQRVAIATDANAIEGELADNGAAAATNRVATLPAVARAQGAGATAGRNTAQSTNLGGLLLTAQLPDNGLESYSASAVVASAASATDIAVLPGNATNTVMVTEVRVSCTQTTAGIIQLHIKKNSSADSGGTSAGMTEIPDDSNFSAADSAALTYTANPTINGTLGDLDVAKLGCMATGTATPNDIYIGNFRQKPIVLRGTAQQLAVNLNGATVTGGSFAITYKWIEATGF